MTARLVSTLDLLRDAEAGGYAVGAFNVIGIEHAQAIVRAAELERSPVILQFSENAIKYHYGNLAPIARCCYELARAASVPATLHLDHATTWELCEQALELGFGSVMFDASKLPFEENIRATAEAARRAHARGAVIEAELGVVGGKEGDLASEKTDPHQAWRFVRETGVDVLAIAVGTSHAMVETTAEVDLELASKLRETVAVPLVLHGSSGVSDADLADLIQRGLVKVNIATLLNRAYTAAVREHLARDPRVVDPRKYLRDAREAVIEVVRDRLRLLGSAGRC